MNLTRDGNPLLEHAKLMNDANPNKKMNALLSPDPVPLQHNVPLSEYLNEVPDDYDNSEMTSQANLEYISPLHERNPLQNQQKRQRENVNNKINNVDHQNKHSDKVQNQLKSGYRTHSSNYNNSYNNKSNQVQRNEDSRVSHHTKQHERSNQDQTFHHPPANSQWQYNNQKQHQPPHNDQQPFGQLTSNKANCWNPPSQPTYGPPPNETPFQPQYHPRPPVTPNHPPLPQQSWNHQSHPHNHNFYHHETQQGPPRSNYNAPYPILSPVREQPTNGPPNYQSQNQQNNYHQTYPPRGPSNHPQEGRSNFSSYVQNTNQFQGSPNLPPPGPPSHLQAPPNHPPHVLPNYQPPPQHNHRSPVPHNPPPAPHTYPPPSPNN